MQELLLHERKGIELYGRLLKLSQDCSISLEEFAREKIRNEEMHVSEIERCFAAEETLRPYLPNAGAPFVTYKVAGPHVVFTENSHEDRSPAQCCSLRSVSDKRATNWDATRSNRGSRSNYEPNLRA